jgi:hypothetical protein
VGCVDGGWNCSCSRPGWAAGGKVAGAVCASLRDGFATAPNVRMVITTMARRQGASPPREVLKLLRPFMVETIPQMARRYSVGIQNCYGLITGYQY